MHPELTPLDVAVLLLMAGMLVFLTIGAVLSLSQGHGDLPVERPTLDVQGPDDRDPLAGTH